MRKSLVVGGVMLCLTLVSPAWAQATEVLEREAAVRREMGTFAKLAEQLNPSVVNITVVGEPRGAEPEVEIPEEFRDLIPPEFWNRRKRRRPRRRRGQGSGVIISSDGRILTNNHVVSRATEITVKLFDGREFEAEIVGTDSNTDVALIKIKDADSLPVAELGNSDQLAVGDWVMAIGNPFGLEATVTVGVLSGKGRVIGAGPYDDFLQTDASINPGNSGGPLFNLAGEVIGINTAVARGGQGIGFAIPINLAKDVADELATDGEVRRGFLGVGMQELNEELRSALAIPDDAEGVLVATVIPDGPAEEAGVLAGDLITSVAGKEVTTSRELLKVVADIEPGNQANLRIIRDGREENLLLTVVERPTSMAVTRQPAKPKAEPPAPILGMQLADTESGVVIAKVEPESPAAEAGLRQGDRILRVGKRRVQNTAQLRVAVDGAGDSVALLIKRGIGTSFVVVDKRR